MALYGWPNLPYHHPVVSLEVGLKQNTLRGGTLPLAGHHYHHAFTDGRVERGLSQRTFSLFFSGVLICAHSMERNTHEQSVCPFTWGPNGSLFSSPVLGEDTVEWGALHTSAAGDYRSVIGEDDDNVYVYAVSMKRYYLEAYARGTFESAIPLKSDRNGWTIESQSFSPFFIKTEKTSFLVPLTGRRKRSVCMRTLSIIKPSAGE